MNIYDVINITDSIHASIPINFIEKELISTPLFNRLHRILQSSMVYLTFPSNKTSRFEHSLGTMHLAGQMFYYSILNAEEEVIDSFLIQIDEQIKTWINTKARDDKFYTDYIGNTFLKGNGKIINHQNITDIRGALFNRYLPSNLQLKHKFAYIITFQAVRIASLLHDIGHFPYSHTIEKAINEVYHSVCENERRNEKEQQFFDCLRKIYNEYGQNEFHEIISIKITDTILKNTEKELYHKISDKNEQNDINKCIISLSFYLAKLILTDNNEFFTDIHSIIDGVIDADRLDYICRDTYNSGTRCDIINYARFIGTMKLVSYYNEQFEKSSFYFAFQAKLVRELEEVLNRRWRIFCDINNHHRVCKTEVLMVNVIKNLSKIYFSEPEKEDVKCEKCKICDKKDKCDLISDHTQMLLKQNISGLWKSIELLNEPSAETLEYLFIQLDDSWFDTMLKKEGYSRFEWPLSDELISEMQDPLHIQLDEIISNKKHYNSVIKRTIDFVDFDIEIIKQFFSNPKYIKLKEMLTKIKSSKIEDSPEYTNCLIIENYLNKDASLFENISKITKINMIDLYPRNHGFFFNFLYELICDLNVVPAFLKPINKLIETTIEETVKSINSQILDCILTLINIKTGYNSKRPIQLVDKNNNLIPMSKISLEASSLKKEQKFLPGFYLYISTKIPIDKIGGTLIGDIKGRVGISTANVLLDILINELKKCEAAF